MKFQCHFRYTASVLVAFLISVVSSASSSVNENNTKISIHFTKEFVEAMEKDPSALRRHLRSMKVQNGNGSDRKLKGSTVGLSDACRSDNLAANTLLQIYNLSIRFMNGSYNNGFDPICSETGINGDLDCDVPQLQEDSIIAVNEPICLQDGGRIVNTTITVNSFRVERTIILENTPICLPESCNVEEFSKFVTNGTSMTGATMIKKDPKGNKSTSTRPKKTKSTASRQKKTKSTSTR